MENNPDETIVPLKSVYYHRYAVITIVLSIICVVLYIGYVQRQIVVSGINLYPHDIVVTIGGQKHSLQPFDTFYFSERSLSSVELKVLTADESDQLQVQQFDAGNYKDIVALVLQSKDITLPCWAKAEVSAAYYTKPGQDPRPKEIEILNSTGTNILHHPTSTPLNQFILPANYHGGMLPAWIGYQREMYGLYPINCADVNDEEKIGATIEAWHAYSPESQRFLFKNAVDAFQSLPMYNDPGPN